MLLLPVLFCADIESHLGRIDYASLPHEALLNLVVEGISNKDVFFSDKQFPEDLFYWDGVRQNDFDEVIAIRWCYYGLRGSIALQWIPSSVTEFNVMNNYLVGTVDISRLPEEFESLDLSFNGFQGTFDLRSLPPTMKLIMAPRNQLTGSLCLEKLPKALETLNLEQNRFDGGITLEHLPEALVTLNLSVNSLSGSLILTSLPPKIQTVQLSDNFFAGSTDFSSLPDSLEMLSVAHNVKLQGEAPFIRLGDRPTLVVFGSKIKRLTKNSEKTE